MSSLTARLAYNLGVNHELLRLHCGNNWLPWPQFHCEYHYLSHPEKPPSLASRRPITPRLSSVVFPRAPRTLMEIRSRLLDRLPAPLACGRGQVSGGCGECDIRGLHGAPSCRLRRWVNLRIRSEKQCNSATRNNIVDSLCRSVWHNYPVLSG